MVLPSNTQYGFWGVDVLAVYGDYLYAGNPGISGAVNFLTRVNLTNFITTPLTTGLYPTATDIIYTQRPLIVQRNGGACVGAETKCTLQMTEPLTTSARFIPNHQYLPFTFKLSEAITNLTR